MPAPKNKKTRQTGKWKILLAKVGFTFCCLILFYGAYLDWKIRQKMDGQIWQLPVEVYSRIETIERAKSPHFEQIKQQLLDNEYRQTTLLGAPGDFKIEENSIVLIRRAFPFPTQPEAQRVLRLRFQNDQLHIIEDLINQRAIESFRLAPKLIAMLQSDKEERLAIKLQQYPRLLIDALLLTEDRRFFQHDGISFLGVARAIFTNLQAGHTVQGGSTLTQQLVKNLFLTNERTFKRKFNEALMALILDSRYDKNRILETYLNEIYLGQNGDVQIHGFELASHFYFGLSTREISLDQIALLVGMVKGPSAYNPWRHPEVALKRRNVVLQLLLEHKVIGEELYNILIARPLGVQPKGQINRKYPAFIQTLQTELREKLGENKTASLLGARIFSTLDPKIQEQAEQAVVNATTQLQSKHKNPHLQAAMVVADYKLGEVRAIVGGTQTQYAGFNRAVSAQRQIGSLVKPSIYLAALAHPELFRLNTPINNQPISIPIKGAVPWTPRNYDRRYSGSVLLMDALARSLNIPTVNIGMKVGLKEVIETQKLMGWDKVTIPNVPATLLGAYSISPYQVTHLYQVIANQGQKIPLFTIDSITDRQGNLLYQQNEGPIQVVAQEAAYQTLFAMQQVVNKGTARSLQNEFAHLHLAGKTGTTNEARDTWFVGIDGENVSTVWLGRDDNGNTKLTGASGALQIYRDYLRRNQTSPLSLPTLPSIQWVGINEYGAWSCDSANKIPVWQDQGQRFCSDVSTSPTTPQTELEYSSPTESQVPKQSLWDILN